MSRGPAGRLWLYEIREAKDGEEAFDRVLSEEPDAPVTSLELTRMNRIELTIRLKQNPKTSSIDVILYSDQPNAKPAAVKAGASAFLSKPVTFGALKKAVDGALTTNP